MLWDLVVDQMSTIGLLKPLDGPALQVACENYARWKEAVRFRQAHALLAKNSYDMAYVCGPKPMIKGVLPLITEKKIPCEVSLENYFGCGTGICYGCTIRTKDGKERSFFILKPDASVEKALDDPKKFVGKSCRVTWKKSTEEVPEAGGKMEIEQILSVEWLDAK